MTSTFTIDHEYVAVHCGKEGCPDGDFAMSRRTYDRTKRTGETWHCPSGHPRVWSGDTTEQKLKRAEAQERHLRDQLQAAGAEAEAVRVKLIRERHRFANGVCPCCNRSFENVARHVRSQHPEYDPAHLAGPARMYRCSCGSRFETPRGLAIHQGHQRRDGWAEPSTPKWRAHLTVVG